MNGRKRKRIRLPDKTINPPGRSSLTERFEQYAANTKTKGQNNADRALYNRRYSLYSLG